jgi:hypothetical protein
MSRDDFKNLRAPFEAWQNPEAFDRLVRTNRPTEVRDSDFKFWREAWVASRFSKFLQPLEGIRLAPDSAAWGDFELMRSGSRAPYEIAEACDADAQPLLKTLRKRRAVLRTSDEELSGDIARRLVTHLIRKKAARRYSAGTSLVLYLNLDDDELVADELPALVPDTEYKFRAISILYSDGKSAHEIYPTLRALGIEQAAA